MKKLLFALFTVLMTSLSAASVSAMSVTPIIIDMTPTGRNARSEIAVENTAIGDIPVAISVSEAFINEKGEVQTKEADDQFLVYPAQALIKPNSKQNFRVQWVGDPELQLGRTFIFSVAQQPVALPDGVSGIQILYNFEVIVSVSPEKGKPELGVLESKFETIDGKRRATIKIKNTGVSHGYLSGSKIKLEAKDKQGQIVWSKSFDPEEIGQYVGAGIMQPGAIRVFTLPFDLPEGGETLSVALKYIGR